MNFLKNGFLQAMHFYISVTLHKDWPGTSALTEIWVDEASGNKHTVEVRMYDTF